MFDWNTDKGTIRSYGVIGPYEDGITELDYMQAFDAMDGRDVTIHLQSEGGSVSTGLSIFNQIEAYDGSVTVHVDAMAYSVASVFPMAAAEVIANKNSTLMVHDPWTIAMGNASEFRHLADVMDKLADDIADTYAAKTGKKRSYWRDVMTKDTYFTAAEAKEIGLVDRIIQAESKPSKAKAAAMISPSFAALHAKLASQRLRLREIKG